MTASYLVGLCRHRGPVLNNQRKGIINDCRGEASITIDKGKAMCRDRRGQSLGSIGGFGRYIDDRDLGNGAADTFHSKVFSEVFVVSIDLNIPQGSYSSMSID